MSLTVDARLSQGDFTLDASFTAGDGITALFGRSGSGKTSLVNIVAGLKRPDRGRIVLDGDVLLDTGERKSIPVHRRRFGYVFQDARLFPHMNVRHNLTYAGWVPGGPARRSDRFDAIIELLGIAPLLERAPHTLSGGERQRVAIGRALLSDPRLLLMDEPLASLDDARKAEILPFLERLRDETRIPILYVSHSRSEVLRLAETVVLLEAGRVVASGPPSAVLTTQALGPFTGEAAGSVIDATVAGHDEADGLTLLSAGSATILVPRLDVSIGRSIRLSIAARDVMIATEEPAGLSALNILPGRITDIGTVQDGMVDIGLDCGGFRLVARVTARSRYRLGLGESLAIHAIVKSVALHP